MNSNLDAISVMNNTLASREGSVDQDLAVHQFPRVLVKGRALPAISHEFADAAFGPTIRVTGRSFSSAGALARGPKFSEIIRDKKFALCWTVTR